MNRNLLFITALFIFSCNGDDAQRDATSSNLLNVGGYAAAVKSILSSRNALSQPSVPLHGLNSLASVITNGGNYIIDASSLGGGFLIGQNGNLRPATVTNEHNSNSVNEKTVSQLAKNIYQESQQMDFASVVNTPASFTKTIPNPLSDIEIQKLLISNKPQLPSLDVLLRNLGEPAAQPVFSTNPTFQLNQIPVNPLTSLPGITKLPPVTSPQQAFVRTILIQLPSYNPLVFARPNTVRNPIIPSTTQKSPDRVLRITKTVPDNEDDVFE